MKLTVLLNKLEDYFYPFDTYDDAIKYIKSNNYVGLSVNGYTNTTYYQKRTQITHFGKDVEQRVPLYTADRGINWYSPCRKQYGDSSIN